MARGNRREKIVLDDDDRRFFLATLSRTVPVRTTIAALENAGKLGYEAAHGVFAEA